MKEASDKSQERVKQAKTIEYEGPYFPVGIDKLNLVYSDYHEAKIMKWIKKRLNEDFADRELSDYIGCYGPDNGGYPQTLDGYDWFWLYSFGKHLSDWEVIFLLPYCKDKSKADGTLTDRSIALYKSGKVDRKLTNTLVKLVYTYLLEWKHKVWWQEVTREAFKTLKDEMRR